jgi:hypothetical protein
MHSDVPSRQGSDLRLQQARDVVEAYTRLLARTDARSDAVYDAADLPCAKEAIKHALAMRLRLEPAAAAREPLRIAYLRLADWQPLALAPATGIDIANARNAGNPIEFASRLAAHRAPDLEKRRAAARAQRLVLLEELRRLGFG